MSIKHCLPTKGQSRQRGLSIVEVMISLAIGAILVAGMTQVFVSVRTSYVLQDSLSRLQENARFAEHFLSRELRQAGALGCLSAAADPVVHLDVEDDDLLFGQFGRAGVQGFASPGDVPGTITLTGAGGSEARDDSEVLVVRGVGMAPGVTTNDDDEKQSADAAVNVFVDGGALERSRISAGDIIAITDCSRGVVVQVADTNTTAGTINFRSGGTMNHYPGSTRPFPDGMRPNADVVAISTRIYYVAPNPEGEPALYRRVGNDPPQELVAGVERMAFEYLENGEYIPAGEVDDWQAVEAVRAEMLLRDRRENLREGNQDIVFMGQPETFEDGRMRLLVHSTVASRN